MRMRSDKTEIRRLRFTLRNARAALRHLEERAGLDELDGTVIELVKALNRAGRAAHLMRGDRARAARYNALPRTESLQLGIRPEHITESHAHLEPGVESFDTVLDVTEPMGMETMVFFTVNGTEICSRVEPSSAGVAGAKMRLHANVDHMHLIDPASDAVI